MSVSADIFIELAKNGLNFEFLLTSVIMVELCDLFRRKCWIVPKAVRYLRECVVVIFYLYFVEGLLV